MKEILLTRGKVALVDDDDFESLNQHKWCARQHKRLTGPDCWYAQRGSGGRKDQKTVYMHRAILRVNNSRVKVDHKDGDGLNNCKANLRRATDRQNQQNRRKLPGCTSQFKGVSWYKAYQKWQASIIVDSQKHHLGYFVDEQHAAEAYKAASAKFFGEFACATF